MRRAFKPVYVNNVDALIPQLWAAESLKILSEHMVMGNLVHRDFQPIVANYGETIHTRKPSKFTAVRKGVNDDVTVQNVVATDVTVVLNQHFHTSFLIRDGEMAKSFKDLAQMFLEPAVLSIASSIDRVLAGQVQRWNDLPLNIGGRLGLGAANTIRDYMLEARDLHNRRFAPMENRNLIVTSGTERFMLGLDEFTGADKVGDRGQAIRNASLGRLLGMDVFMAQNQPGFEYADFVAGATVNGAHAAGATVVAFNAGHLIVVGEYLKITGDETPQLVTGVAGDNITIHPGLKRAVANGAVTTRYLAGAVNLLAGYAAGYVGYIATDGWAGGLPKVGQGLRIGTAAAAIAAGSAKYAIIDVVDLGGGGASILLDRPLDGAIVDNAVVAVAPTGNYNFLFNREALALVVRPLPMPMGQGTLSSVMNDPRGGLSMRAALTYDPYKQGHLVTIDMLAGVAILDTDLGTVLLA